MQNSVCIFFKFSRNRYVRAVELSYVILFTFRIWHSDTCGTHLNRWTSRARHLPYVGRIRTSRFLGYTQQIMTKQIQGFKVFHLKYTPKNTAYHEIFVKEHVTRNQCNETPLGRTLFVVNVPPYTNESSLSYAFSDAGTVSNVLFLKRPSTELNVPSNKVDGFKIAYVIFDKAISVEKALKLDKLKPLNGAESLLCGIKKWTKEYNDNIVDSTDLLKSVNDYIEDHDEKVKEQKRKEKGEEDEDGWVTVTKGGRRPGLPRKENVENYVKKKIMEGKKKKELKNFYTFQIRESKMKHLANLRYKFEEDKKKISALKEARKFKPY